MIARQPKWISALVLACIGFLLLCGGCRHEADNKRPELGPPTVQVVNPTVRTIEYTLQQPGFVNAFEQTAIYSKVSGFIKGFYVDIGSKVHKGQLLADIFVPELKEEHDQMVEQVKLDKQLVDASQQMVIVATRNVENSEAQLAEAKANVDKYEADIVRWQTDVDRLTRMVEEKVVDKEILTETQRQLSAGDAAKKAAEAAVRARDADRLMAEANLGKAKIDVETAKAKVAVTEAQERKAKALLEYTQITAPYDGVVTVRNANTGDYVQAATGDKSAMSPSAIFVVETSDVLRVFIDVPERFAPYVEAGAKAGVRADALSGIEIPATVTRTSWAIRERTRTLWTEIDLTKKEYDGLRPGMYVYVLLYIRRPDVFAVPEKALMVQGNQTYCYLVRDGKAVKTAVDRAIGDDHWVEVDKMKIDDPWAKVTGNEQVIVGELSEITDGEAVKPAEKPAPPKP